MSDSYSQQGFEDLADLLNANSKQIQDATSALSAAIVYDGLGEAGNLDPAQAYVRMINHYTSELNTRLTAIQALSKLADGVASALQSIDDNSF